MKRAFGAVYLISLLVVGTASAANNSKCQSLKDELRAMQRAQSQIMMSLVNNHETFASTLEEYAISAEISPSVTSTQMSKSAKAFRNRGVQGKQMADKLDKATGELLERVANCLK